MLDYQKTNIYTSEAQLLETMQKELSAAEYMQYKNELLKLVRKNMLLLNNGFALNQPRCSVIITAHKNVLL